MKLHIPREVFEQMLAHCRAGLPNEACGFLGGRGDSVSNIYRLTNAAASPVYYRPDDKEMIAAMQDIDDSSLELKAIFHSHVASPPRPSPTDVREAHYPDSVYIIVSLMQDEPEVMGWTIRKRDWRDADGEVEEVGLVVE